MIYFGLNLLTWVVHLQDDKIKVLDELSFRTLFDLHWDSMYNYAYSLLEEENPAKDIVQEVWLDFWQRRESIEIDNIKGYLFKAVRFKVLKEIRDSKFSPLDLDIIQNLYKEDTDTLEEESLSSEDMYLLIENKLAVLPEKCKEVFTLSKLQGLKNKEIAIELNISENTVENHISKAFRLLRA